ncbi:hypothetical protein [Roseofilum casamattae]|uniref:Uncharacterized protein n=1 Tax=Roseofilum casamattae BLCC-M143 TaxID=3022442 RepID=A0ABT7C2N6_9CYAN|nr:hypothetical protein [Roseofilum casamattae]MDJ1185555.1 hypothetical protein [Roseofilum casamattae BLCC-M143]
MIRELVQRALSTGYLTLADEDDLRKLLVLPCTGEDLHAFWALQRAAMAGDVRQESREHLIA